MSDEFIRGLRDTWQSQDHDAAQVLQRLRRKRWEPHLALASALLGCGAAMLAGVWFAWVAAHPGPQRLLFALSAAMLLITVPATCLATVTALRQTFAWHDQPRMLLSLGIRRAESTLQSLRIVRWHIEAIGAFVAVLWACQGLGLLHALGFLMFYTAACAVVCSVAWLVTMWYAPRARAVRQACIRLLAAMEDQEPDEGAGSGLMLPKWHQLRGCRARFRDATPAAW
jgi:hypothetical protein